MAINPDPNYVNQEIENLSLETPGSIEALDQFNAPPPGHSLTGEPGAWPWEKPPVYTDPDEALEKNIPATMFNISPKEQQEADEIPEGEVYKAMQENRPDMYDDLSYVMDVMSEQYEEEGPEEEVIEDEPSFMNMEETV